MATKKTKRTTTKKTTKIKKLPKFTTADYFLREHPFIIKQEKTFRRLISNATKSEFRRADLYKFIGQITLSPNAELREVKKYLKWYKKTITYVPTGLSKSDRKKAKEIAERNEKLCNELMGWIDLTMESELPPGGLDDVVQEAVLNLKNKKIKLKLKKQ